MARASATVSVEALPKPARIPPVVSAPGRMTTTLVPRLSICLRTASLAPWPTATMAISAATPMNTPSMVSAERILLRPIACAAAASDHQRKGQECRRSAAPDRAAAGGWKIAERATSAAVAGDRRLRYLFVGNDLAVAHGHDAVGIGGNIGFVGDQDDR